MRSSVAVLLAVVTAGVASLVGVLAFRDTALVYTLGVPDTGVAVKVPRGQEACQEPIQLPEGTTFDRVRMKVEGGVGQLVVRGLPGRSVLARGRIADAVGEQRVRVGDVSPRGPVAVCLQGVTGRLRVHGAAGLANRSTGVALGGQPVDVDMLVAMERRSRSLLSLVPDMAERAALWRPPFVGRWTYALLGLLLLLGVPAALALAVRSSSPCANDPVTAPENRPRG
jgi:hypothetical protein